jgi:hypothetical protein
VVRSASPILLALAALALTGCVTTQQTNQRYKLRADRTLAGRKPLRVTAPGTDAGVGRVTVLRSAHGGAVVVELRNRTGRALSDLPVTVGVGRTPLNARGGLNFFQTHVASIAPSGTVAWVFTTRRQIPGGRPFALVGNAARSPAALPAITAKPAAKGALVSNSTDVPQYGLPVYALARRGGRYVAAGRTTLQELGTGSSVTVPLRLIGARHGAPLELEALPTIFK